MPKISLHVSEELLTLSYLVRHALFLRYLDRLDSNVVLYVDFVGCLSNSILSDSFIYERHGVPSDINDELNRRDFVCCLFLEFLKKIAPPIDRAHRKTVVPQLL
jgi:hypothetical protein